MHPESENSSEMFACWKNKYDYVKRLHTASKISVRYKKIRIGFDFLRFRIRGKHFERVFWHSEPPYKQTPKIQNAIVKIHPLRLAAQSTVRSLHTEFKKLVVFLLICGSNVASKASNWANWHPEVTLNRPWSSCWSLIRGNSPSSLYFRIGWTHHGPNISFHFLFLIRSERTTKSSSTH